MDAEELSKYDPEAVAQVKLWVEFVGDVIEIDPINNGDILRSALQRLSHKAHEVYPELELGNPVQMSLADLGRWPLPDELGDVYVRLSGDVMFVGEDGPLATAAVMARTIDKVSGVAVAKLNEQERRSP